MKKTRMKGGMCVGEVRLAPIDVGFDVRLEEMLIKLPAPFASAGIDINGTLYLIEGTREEMVSAIRQAGYLLAE